ncbi:MAG: lactonase family protein [Verrucomicrobia bacterium]|nr:lactonase family protein [Verrucomicrobiota bacterium]
MEQPTGNAMRMYVASFNDGKSDRLWLFQFDGKTGALRPDVRFCEGVHSPLYIETDGRGRFLFVADFVENCDGRKGGAVCSYAIDAATGALRFLNRQSSEGMVPCYIGVSADGRFIQVANYGTGAVAVLPVAESGELGKAVAVTEHQSLAGDGKKKPHAHSIVLDAANRFAFAGELGLDKVVMCRFDAATGKLTTAGAWDAKAGAGPRHFTFHPNGRFAYLINELDSTVVAFAYDGATGALMELQTLTTLPDGFTGTNYCADLHVHPSGKFLYGSNRGHNSIAIFAIDTGTGRLQLAGHEATQGNFPRSFILDPTGAWMVVANEKSNTIFTFRVDADTGALSATGHKGDVVAPACLTFLR